MQGWDDLISNNITIILLFWLGHQPELHSLGHHLRLSGQQVLLQFLALYLKYLQLQVQLLPLLIPPQHVPERYLEVNC